jgi:NADH-quinone oxidoreductase subunit D
MLNAVGYALACEKLLRVAVPEGCQCYRMILGEFTRVADHPTCNGAMAMELGAFTAFLWLMRARLDLRSFNTSRS